MKTCLLLIPFILVSCENKNLSSEEKKTLQVHITQHNIITQTRFVQDSINEVQRTRANHQRKNADGFHEYLKAHMTFYAHNWNIPYDIKKDRRLTLDSYLDYCRVHKYKPMEYIRYIN